jgi:hypothetical protein
MPEAAEVSMLALCVDYNERERLPNGGQAVAIKFGRMNPAALEQKLEIGSRVILYDDDTRCEGVLRRGKWIDGWVADLLLGTIRNISAGEFERLRTATNRAALRIAGD